MMEPRVNLITLGVADVARARAFYEALGWKASHNARSKAEVDALYAHALSVGATPIKAPQETSWGGYSGYFADPDGHLWELAWNPFFPLDTRGNLHLPDEAP
jgi:predicted lactoylglutathione lyase